MTKLSKDVEAIIEEYLRKKKSSGNIEEFISACQNLNALILDVKNKGKIITSKDIFSNTRSSNTVKESSPLQEGSAHNLTEVSSHRDENIRIHSIDNINLTVKNKPNQACSADESSTRRNENPPTLKELKSSSHDIMDIIAKLKLAHLISSSVDKYIQTDEFQNNIALFNKGELEEVEKSYAASSRKQNVLHSKLEISRLNNDVTQLKLINSEDYSNTSTVTEKPTKMLINDQVTDDDKTLIYLKNDTIVEETETDLHAGKYLQQTDNAHYSQPKQEYVKMLPFKPEISICTLEPHTSKSIIEIEKQDKDIELTDQIKTNIFEELGTQNTDSIENIIHANVDKNFTTNSQESFGVYERKVREVIKTKRLYNKDGTINEVTETIIITRQRHDPIGTLDNVKVQSVISDEETFDQFEKDDVNFFTAPEHNMQGFMEGKEKKDKKGKSSNNCKVARRAESYIKQCLSCSDIHSLEDDEIPIKNSSEDKETKKI